MSFPVPSHVQPAYSLDAAKWKSKVNEAKGELIALFKQNLMQNTQPCTATNDDHKVHQTALSNSEANVAIVDQSYLNKSYEAKPSQNKELLNDIICKFSLNEEQERAFRIVANHALSNSQDQLKMYLGGKGGTGKTQVIKALMEFFVQIKKASQFLVLAPTGTAAANVGGHTYHSILGINDKNNMSSTSISIMKEKLLGVKYIFLDEVSMLSCHDMYKISAQLAKAFNNCDLPFGGMNMIFAGDFAQLPPVLGGESCALYSGLVGSGLHSSLTHYVQESAIGKALWHQITTVVILQKNMHHVTQSSEDHRFRMALDNMRYRSCTSDDLLFLRTRIVGTSSSHPSLTSSEFRNVSIITAWNSQKDRVNELGCERFAKDTNQALILFFSEDQRLADSETILGSKKRLMDRNNVVGLSHEEKKLYGTLHRIHLITLLGA